MPVQKLSSLALLILSLLLRSDLGADISPNVPLEHWGYGFLERFEARGFFSGLGDGIKPFSRLEMARALNAVAAAVEEGGELTRVDGERLRRLQEEFGKECRTLAGEESKREGEVAVRKGLGSHQPLFRYEHEQGELQADLSFRQQTDSFSGRGREQTEQIFRTRLGGEIRGNIREGVGYFISFEQTREQGSRTYILRDDVFERRIEVPQLKGNLADYHEGKAYLNFSLPFVDVEFGKDQVAWGPGPVDNLGLSGNAPSFDMLRLRARYGAFKLVSIAGALRPCPDRPDSPLCGNTADLERSYIVNHMSRTLEPEKYLAAHRLEVALATWIDVGFQEVVVYGDRGLEVTYLNPVMFYWAAQSYLGDKDNLMMGLDLDIHPGNGLRFYLAYVVDDLKKLKILSDDFANKFSFQSGFLWVDPLGLRDVDLRGEYVRIEPWIYTHKFPINTFRHFDGPLGHALGPNSDRWQLSATHRLRAGLGLHGGVSRTRHGDNVLLEDGSIRNIGGDLHLGWRPGDERESKKFLAGKVSRWTRVEVGLDLHFWAKWHLETGWAYEWGKDVPLPPRWGSNVALENRTGYGDGKQREFHFDLRYNYF